MTGYDKCQEQDLWVNPHSTRGLGAVYNNDDERRRSYHASPTYLGVISVTRQPTMRTTARATNVARGHHRLASLWGCEQHR